MVLPRGDVSRYANGRSKNPGAGLAGGCEGLLPTFDVREWLEVVAEVSRDFCLATGGPAASVDVRDARVVLD